MEEREFYAAALRATLLQVARAYEAMLPVVSAQWLRGLLAAAAEARRGSAGELGGPEGRDEAGLDERVSEAVQNARAGSAAARRYVVSLEEEILEATDFVADHGAVPVEVADDVREVSLVVIEAVGAAPDDEPGPIRAGPGPGERGMSLGYTLGRTQLQTPAPSSKIVRVWFATNRKPVTRMMELEDYGKERDGTLHLGWCEVAVPESHLAGSGGRRFWDRLGEEDDTLHLSTLTEAAEDEFWERLAAAVGSREGDRHAVLYIHGFRTTFRKAALGAARLRVDLDLDAEVAFFSWPSLGHIPGYPADEATIEASELRIGEFLVDFAARTGADKVHVVAHSMGNRALLKAVDRIAGRAADALAGRLDQVILAAPDVDSDVFRDFSPAYAKVASRTTLYVSAHDRPLGTSGFVHAYPRAGYAPPITICPGIDTIDVSDLDLGFVGHGYFLDSVDVMSDMSTLMVHGSAPSDRRLNELSDPRGAYWRF